MHVQYDIRDQVKTVIHHLLLKISKSKTQKMAANLLTAHSKQKRALPYFNFLTQCHGTQALQSAVRNISKLT